MQLLIPEPTRREIEDLDYDAIEYADVNLMMAWQILKDEACPRCGIPNWIALNSDRNIQFEVRERFCYACEAVDQFEEKQRKENPKLSPGSIAYAIPYMVDKSPLPDRLTGSLHVRQQDEYEYGEVGSKLS